MASTSPHPTSARRIRPARSLIALGALGILLLTGCGGSTSTSDSGASGTAIAPAGAGAGSAPGVSGAKGSSGGATGAPEAQSAAPAATDRSSATSTAGTVAVGGPKLTKSASIELSVRDISAAAARVRAVAAGLQAQVLSEQIGSGGPGDPMPLQGKSTAVNGVPGTGSVGGTSGVDGVGTLTLSVPADKLDTALDQLARIGTVRQRSTSSQDVTAQYVDTQSRQKTMRASVERVRALMSQAKDLGQVVVLESELSRREADLESLESQLSVLTSSVELSPVTVILSTPASTPVTSTGFLAGLRSGWDAFTTSATGLVTVVGAVLPFAVLLSVIGAGVVWWLRRRHPASAAPAGL